MPNRWPRSLCNLTCCNLSSISVFGHCFLESLVLVGDRAAEVDISITPRQGNDQALRARACILRESRMRDFQVRIPQTKKA